MKIKNVMQLLLIALSFAFMGCENGLITELVNESGMERSSTDGTGLLDKWDLGTGFNSNTADIEDNPFIKTEMSGIYQDGDNYDFNSIYISNESEFSEFMETIVSVDAQFKFGALKAGSSFASNVSSYISYTNNSVTMVKKYRREMLDINLNHTGGYNADAKAILNSNAAFVSQYGDSYTSGVVAGAYLYYFFTASSNSSNQISSTNVKAALNLKYKTYVDVNAEAEFTKDEMALFKSYSYNENVITNVALDYSKEITINAFIEATNAVYFKPSVLKTRYQLYPIFTTNYTTNCENLDEWKSLRKEIRSILYETKNVYIDKDFQQECEDALAEIDAIIFNFDLDAVTTLPVNRPKYDHIINHNPNYPDQDPDSEDSDDSDQDQDSDDQVIRLDAGQTNTMIIKNDGTLWTTGRYLYTQNSTPVQIMGDVKSVSAGYFHTMIIKKDGTLWTAGKNKNGQLGDGSKTDKYTPVMIMGDVKSVSGGYQHTIILKNDDTLWTTGSGTYGQLGDGSKTDKYTPVMIMGDVKSVSAGKFHTMILKNDGTLWGTGYNRFCQLGDGTTIDRSTPVMIMGDVKSVSAGQMFTMILKNDGTLWGTGYNGEGQFGDGTRTDKSSPVQLMENVKYVSAGNFHTMILKNDSTLWATGQGYNGQLGDGSKSNISTHVQIMGDVKSVSAGHSHTMIIKNDDTLWGTGSNSINQLGDGTTTNRYTPVMIMSVK